MTAVWYTRIEGAERGPLTPAEMKSLVAQGRVGPDSPIRKDGMQQWVPARSVKGLLPSGAKAGPSPAPPPVSATAVADPPSASYPTSPTNPFDDVEIDHDPGEPAPRRATTTRARRKGGRGTTTRVKRNRDSAYAAPRNDANVPSEDGGDQAFRLIQPLYRVKTWFAWFAWYTLVVGCLAGLGGLVQAGLLMTQNVIAGAVYLGVVGLGAAISVVIGVKLVAARNRIARGTAAGRFREALSGSRELASAIKIMGILALVSCCLLLLSIVGAIVALALGIGSAAGAAPDLPPMQGELPFE